MKAANHCDCAGGMGAGQATLSGVACEQPGEGTHAGHLGGAGGGADGDAPNHGLAGAHGD